MTAALLLKAIEIIPEAVTALKGDVTAIIADKDMQQKVLDSIKLAEDALAQAKSLLS